ncbi:hypothetical protein PM708P3_00001 [Parabacteroides phage PM708P3]|nr:hypothetical protein PM708P3_00001 [Parabacteroides phage PM708P3]
MAEAAAEKAKRDAAAAEAKAKIEAEAKEKAAAAKVEGEDNGMTVDEKRKKVAELSNECIAQGKKKQLIAVVAETGVRVLGQIPVPALDMVISRLTELTD